MSYGYSGFVTELRTSTAFYRIYYMHNAQTGDKRLLYNWGRLGKTGQFKVDMDYWNYNTKVDEKRYHRDKNYTIVRHKEEIKEFGAGLLEQAGINTNAARQQQQPQQQATPVEASAMASFTTSLATLMDTLHGQPLTPEIVSAYQQLRSQFADIQREVRDAEGRMEHLTALITRKFEGA